MSLRVFDVLTTCSSVARFPAPFRSMRPTVLLPVVVPLKSVVIYASQDAKAHHLSQDMEPDSESRSTITPSDHDIEGPSEAVPTTSSHAIDSESVTRNEPTAPSIKAATAAESTGKSDRCKCPPPPSKKEGRNLVVCIDGTANQFSLNVGFAIDPGRRA